MSDEPDNSDALRETRSDLLPPLAPPDVYDPVIEAYKKDVDRTLIRENLKLTHEQRSQKLEDFVAFLMEMRNAKRTPSGREPPG